MKKIFIFLPILLIVAINLPPLRWVFGEDNCEFSNGDGFFTYVEVYFKGDDFQECQRKFVEFKKRNLGDTTLYRLCPKNIFHFWDYGQYLFSEKYRLPYKPWSEIEARRGPITNKSGFQDF